MDKRQSSAILRIVSILFTAGIIAFLAFGGLFTLIRQPVFSSYYENRFLEPIPEYSSAGVLDGSYFSSLNTYLQEHAVGRNTLLRWETFLNLDILQRPVVNDVVIGNDVLLGWQDFWLYGQDDLKASAESAADRIAAHARKTEENGGHFYYIAVPHQALAFSDEYPPYLQSHEDYYRDVSTFLADALQDRSVSFLDMWKVFQSGGNLVDISSRTDNHFSIIGALETCRYLLAHIREDTDYETHFLDDGNCHVEWLPNHYLGSRSRKLFDLWPSDERLGIVVTESEPQYTRTDKASWLEGQRDNSCIYSLPSSDEVISYDIYMGGDWGCTEIRTDRPELPCILIYGDSFTNPVECLLWQGFDTMYSFDFRHYSQYDLDELIDRYKPEIVVCIRDYEAVLKTDGNGL